MKSKVFNTSDIGSVGPMWAKLLSDRAQSEVWTDWAHIRPIQRPRYLGTTVDNYPPCCVSAIHAATDVKALVTQPMQGCIVTGKAATNGHCRLFGMKWQSRALVTTEVLPAASD